MSLVKRLFELFDQKVVAAEPAPLTPCHEAAVARLLRGARARDDASLLREEFEELFDRYQQGPHEAPLMEPRGVGLDKA